MKQFFEQYGGIALGILALLVLIAMITPVGNIIKTSLQGTAHKFSSIINSQVDDDLDAMSSTQYDTLTSITVPYAMRNFEGQSSFSSTYTPDDKIWPARYDFKDSLTYYVETKGVISETRDIAGNFESAGFGIIYNVTHGYGFSIFIEDQDWYTAVYSGVMSSDELTRITGTYDGQTIKIYVNGELKNQQVLPGVIRPSSRGVIAGNPGSGYNRSDLPVTDEIYRIGVFDGVLSLEQIESLQYK